MIDTHVQADHLSTGRALADAAGADYVLSERAAVALPFKGVNDGDDIELGNVVIKVLSTPGHTPEHVCLLVTDRTRAKEPWFVVTGHTLMVGDLGRTELATSTEQGAKDLFGSIQKLKALPDHLEVLPDAYAGSVCGRNLSANPISAIGFERWHNKAFRIDSEPEFVNFMLKDIPPAPPEAARLRAVNSGHGVAGPLSDRWGRKGLIVGGMWVQAAGLILTALTGQFEWWLLASILLGLGTAMVYPSLIAAVSDASHPSWRARSLSVYRFWRDLGYAIGALSAGLIADRFGFGVAILVIGVVTFLSGAVVAVAMRERASIARS